MDKHRDRASGWKHAKLSGHSNEELVCEKLIHDRTQQERLLKAINDPDAVIINCECGGLHEAKIPSVLGGMTKDKADISVRTSTGTIIGISIKKSLAGQVFLVRDENFIKGFELQYNKVIPEDIKRAISLFWGSAQDTKDIIMSYSKDDLTQAYELHKHRLTAQTLQRYNQSLYMRLLNWLKENISSITDYCFARGQAKDKTNQATIIWYINLLGEHNIDKMFHIDSLCRAAEQNKNIIEYGTRSGGTTIALPFGFVQWHQAQMQFHHRYDMIRNLAPENY